MMTPWHMSLPALYSNCFISNTIQYKQYTIQSHLFQANSFVKNANDHFDTHLCKNIYTYRKQLCKMIYSLIKFSVKVPSEFCDSQYDFHSLPKRARINDLCPANLHMD